MPEFTLNDLPAAERPRERLVRHGAEALSAQELIALVLGRGTRGEPVMNLSQSLLSKFGSLAGIANASLEQLQQVRGLGLAKAAQLKACMAIAYRILSSDEDERSHHNRKKPVGKPEDLAKELRKRIGDKKQEHLLVVSLDNRNRTIGIDEVAVGTLNASLIHPRETFSAAINRHAASIIISHNHPSGDPTPSAADISVTKRLKEAGILIGIELLDHIIIVNNDNYYSFREKGMIG